MEERRDMGGALYLGSQKNSFTGPQKQSGLTRLKICVKDKQLSKRKKKEFSTVRFSSCNLKINFAILVFLKWFSVTFDGSYI